MPRHCWTEFPFGCRPVAFREGFEARPCRRDNLGGRSFRLLCQRGEGFRVSRHGMRQTGVNVGEGKAGSRECLGSEIADSLPALGRYIDPCQLCTVKEGDRVRRILSPGPFEFSGEQPSSRGARPYPCRPRLRSKVLHATRCGSGDRRCRHGRHTNPADNRSRRRCCLPRRRYAR